MQSTAEQLRLFPDSDAPGALPAFSVRVSARARRLSIKVFPRGRVEVVVPRRTRARDVQAFVEENREWIERSRESFARIVAPGPFVLPHRVELRAIGQSFRIRYERRHEALCVSALKRWLGSIARSEFAPRLGALSVLTDSPFKAMHIRGQRSCWGSHSSSGTISINYCLLFLEPVLLRYLMIHELCHARHMNHSRRFWQRVGRFEPEYRRLDKALGEAWTQIPAWVGLH